MKAKSPKKQVKSSAPDLTSVRSLVTSVSALAAAVGITPNGVQRWIAVNRIPGAHIIKVANFYDVELADLLPLTGSDKSNVVTVKNKSRDVLPALLKVYRGKRKLEEVCEELGITPISARLTLFHWGDKLPTLHTTLVQLDEGRINLEMAMQRLNVTKYTVHRIRSKYGFAPGRPPKAVKVAKREVKWDENKAVALQVIAGKMTTAEAMAALNASYRSVFRYIERLTPLRLNELTFWPPSFRAALAEEIEHDLPNYAQKWVQFAKEAKLHLVKRPKFPESPEFWGNQPLKRLLVAVLLGEATLEEVAKARGGDPSIIAALMTSDLRSMDLTFEEVTGLPMAHQLALAEVLIAILDRKRHVT